MNLYAKIERLCQETGLPVPDNTLVSEESALVGESASYGEGKERKPYLLRFDALLSVSVFQDKAVHVLLTDGFTVPVNDRDYWEKLQLAMHKTFAWHGLATHLALDKEGDLSVQTFVPEEAEYPQFFDMMNHHCQFCENLVEQLKVQPVGGFEQHAFILP